MAFSALSMMRIALELARDNRVYETMATKFFEHFVYISGAMKKMGGRDYQLWDEEDGFFYDVLRYPDGRFHKFEVRSLVGLIPLFAIEVVEERRTRCSRRRRLVHPNRRDLVGQGCFTETRNGRSRHVLSIVDRASARRGCCSGFGIRPSSSRRRAAQPVEAPQGSSLRASAARGALRAGRVRRQDQGWQLELARSGLVPDDVSSDRISEEVRQGERVELRIARWRRRTWSSRRARWRASWRTG
jgi:hypothetical protein